MGRLNLKISSKARKHHHYCVKCKFSWYGKKWVTNCPNPKCNFDFRSTTGHMIRNAIYGLDRHPKA